MIKSQNGFSKRILIVGTVPYNTSGPSRSFESYFHGIDTGLLAQVFSNPSEPRKGHCHTLYQITDKDLLKRWLNRKHNVGKKFNINDLQEMNSDKKISLEKDNKIMSILYSLGAKHTPL